MGFSCDRIPLPNLANAEKPSTFDVSWKELKHGIKFAFRVFEAPKFEEHLGHARADRAIGGHERKGDAQTALRGCQVAGVKMCPAELELQRGAAHSCCFCPHVAVARFAKASPVEQDRRAREQQFWSLRNRSLAVEQKRQRLSMPTRDI